MTSSCTEAVIIGGGPTESRPAGGSPNARVNYLIVEARCAARRSAYVLPNMTWSRQSRRFEPMSLSEYPFCQGDRGEIGPV